MKKLRLALITRRFWPLVGGAETVMANLASEFRQQGHDVTLLTARWERQWPADIVHREVPVRRLSQPKARGWGTFRYMQALGHWLRNHRNDLDGVIVSMLKHDAHTAVHFGLRSKIPIVLRAEGGGETGDCHWHEVGRFGLRIREKTKQAGAWIAPSPVVYDELLKAGYPSHKGFVVPNAVPIPEARSPDRQSRARIALSETHSILSVGPREPLVVYTGRLHEAKGLLELVEAWPLVLERWPNARLWLVGEGPAGLDIWDEVHRLHLTHSVIMPGSFDELTEVLDSADAFVLPSHEEGMSMSLLEAMAAAVPIAASDIPGNRLLIEHGRHGLLFPPKRSDKIAAAIIALLENREQAELLGKEARKRVSRDYSISKMANDHLAIINAVSSDSLEDQNAQLKPAADTKL